MFGEKSVLYQYEIINIIKFTCLYIYYNASDT